MREARELVMHVEREVRVDQVLDAPMRLDLTQRGAVSLVREHAVREPVEVLGDRYGDSVVALPLAGFGLAPDPDPLPKKRAPKLSFTHASTHFTQRS